MTRPFSAIAPFALLSCLLVGASGCATRGRVHAQQEEIEQLKRQLAAVQREQSETRAQAEQVRNQVFILTDRLSTSETRLSQITQPPPKLEVVKLVPHAQKPDPLAPRLRVVKAAPPADPLDEEGYDPSADEAEMFSFGGDDEEAAHASDPDRRASPPRTARGAVPEALADTSTARAKEDPMTQYRRAFSLFQERKFGDASVAFEEFVRANPTHDYADNAYYWMGECFYGQGEFVLAIGEFQKVPELYPGGNKVPDSLLKIGLSYHNLNNAKNAEKTLRQLIDAYPQSDAAKIAKQKLEKIQQ